MILLLSQHMTGHVRLATRLLVVGMRPLVVPLRAGVPASIVSLLRAGSMLSEVTVRLLRRHVHRGRERAVPTGPGDILQQLLRVALDVGVARWHGIEGVLRSILAHLVVTQLCRALGCQAGHVVPRVLPLLVKLGVVLPLILRGLRP